MDKYKIKYNKDKVFGDNFQNRRLKIGWCMARLQICLTIKMLKFFMFILL